MTTQHLKLETQEKYLIMATKVKTYDCVEEVRKSRNRISKDLKGKTLEEIIAYFKNRRKSTTVQNN